ncbi:acyl-CoA N-acyltransferase [Heliocybe sulcata]|uniref:Acyl-CoA N-acyltransferase n=1 Tax=Heliocybe sulcata TaxID=5364 RepID=A0A5C3NH93_9AGAM|nr:acyl-CoA N-acyltransferase [Heliocybe sulcata]
MSLSPLHPLQLNPETGEPYLRLPHPHQSILITPIRPVDADARVEILNDARVYDYLSGIPHPYTREHAQEWTKLVTARSDELLQQLQGPSHDQPKVVDGCPVMTLREVKEDGTDIFIGDVSIARSSFVQIVDPVEKARLRAENAARPNGDPEILYMIGDWLAPSHHGRGIMTAAIQTLVHEWAVPRMGCRKILVSVRKGNVGSRRVFEKLDFEFKGVLEDHQELTAPGRAGGPKWSLEIFEWMYRE